MRPFWIGPVAIPVLVAAACAGSPAHPPAQLSPLPPPSTYGPARDPAAVGLTDAPRIDGAETVGMVADIRTSVESGTEIDSRAYTFIAYLGDYYAFTTLTTDPGSALPALPAQFAADLLVKTVS